MNYYMSNYNKNNSKIFDYVSELMKIIIKYYKCVLLEKKSKKNFKKI